MTSDERPAAPDQALEVNRETLARLEERIEEGLRAGADGTEIIRRLSAPPPALARVILILKLAGGGGAAGVAAWIFWPDPPARVSAELMEAPPPAPAPEAAPLPRAVEPSPPALPPVAPAKPVVRPAKLSAAPEPAREVADEITLIAEARAALETDLQRALRLVRQLEAEFPEGKGLLIPERELIAVSALLDLGRTAEARARADQFQKDYPHSPVVARMNQLFERGSGR